MADGKNRFFSSGVLEYPFKDLQGVSKKMVLKLLSAITFVIMSPIIKSRNIF